MTRWIIGSSVRLAAAVLAATAVLLYLGVSGLRHAAVETLPEFLPPQVQVQTEALGLSTTEVEQLITVPLEDEFNGLAFLNHITSRSVPGLSTIELDFAPGTDIYKARQLVTERVAQGPAVVNVGTPPVMIQPLSAEGRVMMIGLTSRDLNPIDLSTLARWRIRPRLLAVPGVANVTIWGERDKQLQVLADPARMSAAKVTLNQVVNTAGDAMWTSPLTFVEASSPGADGFIDTPNQRLSLQHILPISTAPDLASVPVEDTTGPLVRLGDVSTVVEGHPLLRGDAVLGDAPGFILVVQKFPGANTLAVTKGLEAAAAELESGLPGVTLNTKLFRPATFIETALRHIGYAALAGLVLTVLWLGLAARSWRVALIALIAIVLSAVTAAYVLYLFGTTFNTLTLAGLTVALAVLIDDAVAGVTAVRRRLTRPHEDDNTRPKAALVAEAAVRSRGPLGWGLAVVVLAVLPLLTLSGVGGSFARSLTSAYLLAVAASTLVALIVTPALAYLLLPSHPERHPSRPAAWIEHRHDRWYPRFTRHRRTAYGAAALLGALCLALVPQLGNRSLIPPMQDRDLLIQWQALPGTSLTEMQRVLGDAGSSLRAVPGVNGVASHIGQSLMGDQIVDVDSAETWVRVAAGADYGAAIEAVRNAVAGYPGLRHEVTNYPQAALDAAATGNGKAVTVRLYGTDQPTLAAQGARIRAAISTLPGVTGARTATQTREPAVQIQADVAAAARYGLKPGDIRRASAALAAGIPVGSYYQQQQIFDVSVWSVPSARRSLTSIQNLMLDTPAGGQVPLKDVANVAIQGAPTEIDHDKASRYLDITADVHGADLGSTLGRITARVQSLALPLGYHAEVLSSLQQQQNADRHLLLYALAAAAGILLLLQAALRSWSAAALNLLLLPAAASGGVLTALIANTELTAGALIGFLAVTAIAARDTISLTSRARELSRDDERTPDTDAISRAAREAAAPVVTTAAAVVLALLPFVVRGDIAGVEILRPLALVVIGGMATSTFTTLFLLPALHSRFAPRTTGPGTA